MTPAIIAPALLLTSIAGTAAVLGGIILWARHRQRRATMAQRQARDAARAQDGVSASDELRSRDEADSR